MNDKELIQTAKEIVTDYSTADWKALKNILAPEGAI